MYNFIDNLLSSLNISTTPYLIGGVIIFLFVVIAYIVDLFVIHVLKRLVKYTKSDLDDKIIDIVHRPVFFSIILFSISYSVQFIGSETHFPMYTSRVINTIIALIWAYSIIKISNLLIDRIFSKLSDISGLRKDIVPLISNVTKIAIFISAGMIILSIWKVDITPLLASAGILGIGIAMAAKDTLANFFGGISVFLDKPYKIGDYVELEHNEMERGEVVDIGIRSTRIKTRDDIMITIPNSVIANSKIVNESAPIPKFRIRVPVGVAYGSDIELVEKVLLEVAHNNPEIKKDPEPRVRFREFGDSSLNFELLCWADDPALRGQTKHELNKAVYKIFEENNITIPFPQRDIHIKKD